MSAVDPAVELAERAGCPTWAVEELLGVVDRRKVKLDATEKYVVQRCRELLAESDARLREPADHYAGLRAD